MGDFEFVVSEGPQKGTAHAFPGTHFYVGSGDECHLRFQSADVQPKHAEIRFDPNGVPWIRDLTGQGERHRGRQVGMCDRPDVRPGGVDRDVDRQV